MTLALAMTSAHDTKTTGNKGKNKQVGLSQTKELLPRTRNNQQSENTTYGMRENIHKLCVCSGVNLQNM